MRRSLIVVGIAVLVLCLFVWVYLPALTRYHDLRAQQEQIEKEIAQLDEKIKALMEEKMLLQNDVQYIEKIIREEMGLVKPGEEVYKFITDNLNTPSQKPPAAESSPEEEAPRRASVQKPAVLPKPAAPKKQ